MSYKEYLRALSLGSAFKGTYGTMFTDGVAKTFDDLLADTKSSVKASWPEYAAAAGDDYALGLIGSDSAIRRYASESDTTYGARLMTRWEKHAKAGTTDPIEVDLTGIGYSQISFIYNASWAPSPPDGVTTWWSRFWLVIRGHGFTMPTYGGGTLYGGGGLYGGTYTTAQITEIQTVIKQWKPAHSYCEAIVIAYSANILPVGKVVAGWNVGNDAAYIPCGF